MWQLFSMGVHAFDEWVRDNYSGFEAQEVLDRYVQSGDYPEEFLAELSAGVLGVM